MYKDLLSYEEYTNLFGKTDMIVCFQFKEEYNPKKEYERYVHAAIAEAIAQA